MKRILIAFAVFGMVASIGLVAGVGSASAQEVAQTGDYDVSNDISGTVVDVDVTNDDILVVWTDTTNNYVSSFDKDTETLQNTITLDEFSAYAGDSDIGTRFMRVSEDSNAVFIALQGGYYVVTDDASTTTEWRSAGTDQFKSYVASDGDSNTLSVAYYTGSEWREYVYWTDRTTNVIKSSDTFSTDSVVSITGENPDSYSEIAFDESRNISATYDNNNRIFTYDGLLSSERNRTDLPTNWDSSVRGTVSLFNEYTVAHRLDDGSVFGTLIVEPETDTIIESYEHGDSANYKRSGFAKQAVGSEEYGFIPGPSGTTDQVRVIAPNGSLYSGISTTSFDDISDVEDSGFATYTSTGSISTYAVQRQPESLNITVEKENLNLSEDGPKDFNFSGTITYADGSTEPLTSDQIGIVAYTSGVIDVDVSNMSYSISPDFDGDPQSTDFTVSLADSNVSATSPTITVDYRPAEPVVSNLTLEQSVFDTEAGQSVTGSFRLVNKGDLPTNVTLYQGIDGFGKTTTNGSVTYNANTTGSYSFDVPSAEGNYTANVTSIAENGFTSTTTADIRVANVSGPTVEITSIETTDNEPYNDPEGTVTISVKHNSLNDSVRSASISPNFTTNTQQVSFGEIPALGTATETVTLDDQPPEENTSGDYTVITEGDSATFTIRNVIGTPSLSNLRNPAFSNMDRVIAVLGDTTLIILFLITGASAMVSKETSGSIGSVMFMLLLLPAWLAVGVPLYLFGVAIPAVVIIYQQSQSDQPAQEIRIEGMR